ncbi:MAG: NADP-dependent oxidoreductase [Sphingomonadales bacterium]
MTADTNKRIILASRPLGWVSEDNFEITESARPEPADGQVLIRVIHLSLDPYMRARMNDVKSYVPPFQTGEVISGGAIGEIVASRNPGFAEGDIVSGMLGWEQYSISNGAGLIKLDPGLAPLPSFLGVLGMPGFTAYVGLIKIGQPRAGETVFVSAASGAVGSVVGQIAKIKGCRAAGSAGTDEKVRFITDELGFDAAFNYKTEHPHQTLATTCPDGIDINFENVGGETLEAALAHMNPFGRIAFCGAISQYNDTAPPPGPRNLVSIIGKRLRMEGFIVSDHSDLLPDFTRDMSRWLQEGRVKARETVIQGLENTPKAFVGLFKGENFGKLVTQVSDEP